MVKIPIYKPFIKWVGGKRQLLEQFQTLYPRSFLDQKIAHYYEPFLGGGAVFFDLRNKFGLDFHADLYDINTELINTYQVIKDSPELIITELKKYEYNKETFFMIRDWDKNPNFQIEKTTVERAARFIYLNRTCFNGMYRVNSKGLFNVPFGKYSNPQICDAENIKLSSEALQNTNISNSDFSTIIDKVHKGDFIYLDPPYDTLSNRATFTDYNKEKFGRTEQERLAVFFKELDKKGCFVMLSNHNTNRIQSLYKGFHQEIVKATRMINSNATKRGTIEEIVILNY